MKRTLLDRLESGVDELFLAAPRILHFIKPKRKIERPAYEAPVWEFHSPLNFSPRIPKDRILIVASHGDRLCPFEHVRQLTGKWEVPKHYFLHGGHWLVFNNIRGKVWYGFLEKMGFTS